MNFAKSKGQSWVFDPGGKKKGGTGKTNCALKPKTKQGARKGEKKKIARIKGNNSKRGERGKCKQAAGMGEKKRGREKKKETKGRKGPGSLKTKGVQGGK